MNENHDERLEMVNDFVMESRELLDEIEPQIIVMEEHVSGNGEVDNEVLNGIFRLFHSIKGMASFLDLQTVMTVTHETETLLDIFRKNEISLDVKNVELLYKTSDLIRNMLDSIEQKLNDNGFEEAAAAIIDEIKGTINNYISPEETLPFADKLEEFNLVITSEMVEKFVAEALEAFDEAETALLKLETDVCNTAYIEQAFRAFHSFKGNAGFFGYKDFEQVSHRAENILDDFRQGEREPDGQTISALLGVIDSMRRELHMLTKNKKGSIEDKDKLLTALDKTAVSCFTEVMPSSIEIINDNSSDDNKNDCAKKTNNGGQQAIRVDVDKLDTLLDLVGELVIAEAMVSHNPDLQGLQLERFDKAVLQLSKITREIQDVSMSMRMIPLAGTFKKMIRLVRDLALKENKKVNLEIIGEETEVDKTIIEQISDPLVHIIRNAVDHGLESHEERIALGKPETGHIVLEAKHSAGEVWIIIKDDGKGLNRDKIIRKAIDRGLITDENKEMKDEEVWKLIFEPGLSTAERVSSISGRGVGMDVVKKNIEKLRGKVDIKSIPGEGTLFAIRIPLTLAIIEGMVIRVGQAHYTIPIVSIKESFQPRADQITLTPEGLEIVNVRGELLPIIRLHELYNVQPEKEKLVDGILILVESDGYKCCLLVDELIGQQQVVIKGLPEYLGNVRGVSGFAILGDGEVSMILDVSNLINSAEELIIDSKRSLSNLISIGGETI